MATLDKKSKKQVSDDGRTLLSLASANSNMYLEVAYEEETQLLYRSVSKIDLSAIDNFVYKLDQQKVIAQFSKYKTEAVKIPIQVDQIYRQQGPQLVGVGNFKGYQIIQIE